MPEHSHSGWFPGSDEAGLQAYDKALQTAQRTILQFLQENRRPYSGRSAPDFAKRMAAINPCPAEGRPLAEVLDWIGEEIMAHSVNVAHPKCLAHLHCPPLIPALAAEAIISVLNQSLDSWDQAPAATYLEQHLVNWLADLVGHSSAGDGIFTSGGTQSNFMGLLLAREAAGHRHGVNIRTEGLNDTARRFRILCSEQAHFSVRQAAALLGLGEAAVVSVATDGAFRLSVPDLVATLARLQRDGMLPIAVVATAGTTDFGAIDPIAAVADVCQDQRLWLHVDAAYGGVLLLNERLAGRLQGIDRADSVAIDFHKFFYQPISCSTFLVRDARSLDLMQGRADYLNPVEHADAGILDLVGKSVQTTRRFDGLKLFTSLQVLGRTAFNELVDGVLALAAEMAARIAEMPDFELLNPNPALSTLVFRYRPPACPDALVDELNQSLRQELMGKGLAVVGQTRHRNRIHLKLTLLNPRTRPQHVLSILETMREQGSEILRTLQVDPGRTRIGA